MTQKEDGKLQTFNQIEITVAMIILSFDDEYAAIFEYFFHNSASVSMDGGRSLSGRGG